MTALDRITAGAHTAWGWTRLSARTVVYAGTSSTVGALTPGPALSQWLFGGWCRATLRQLRVDLHAPGVAEVTGRGPCILAANHLSSVDIPVLGAVLGGDYRWVAKRELFRVPFVGWHLWSAGHIPVDRRGGRRAVEDLQRRFEAVLARGASILIFPEGTRSRDGELQRFKMGAFQAAARSQVHLVPLVLDGTQAIVPKGKLTMNARATRRVEVRALEPLHPDALLPGAAPDEQARALREEAHRRMARALAELRDRAHKPAAA